MHKHRVNQPKPKATGRDYLFAVSILLGIVTGIAAGAQIKWLPSTVQKDKRAQEFYRSRDAVAREVTEVAKKTYKKFKTKTDAGLSEKAIAKGTGYMAKERAEMNALIEEGIK